MQAIPQERAREFLELVWPQVPRGGALALWHKGSRRTATFADPGAAAVYATGVATETDIYLHAGLAPVDWKEPKRRPTTAQIGAVPGVWADIDVNGSPDGEGGVKSGAAPSIESAIALAAELLQPTALVASGGGVQAWWLFDEPWVFGSVEERAEAGRLLKGFELRLAAVARHLGFKLDPVADLARLMRLVGTLNHKSEPPRPVQLLEAGPRHALQTVREVVGELPAAAAAPAPAQAMPQLSMNGLATPDLERIIELCDVDPRFKALWDAKEAPDDSRHDAALLWTLSQVMSEEEAVGAARWHRIKRRGDSSSKPNRIDYWQRTIGSMRRKKGAEDATEAVADLVNESEAGASSEVVVSLFNRVIAGPEIHYLEQDGVDPELTQYQLVLRDGRRVPLGRAEQLLDEKKFRAAFMAVTGHLPNKIGNSKDAPRYDEVIRALLRTAVVNEHPEYTRSGPLLGWVEEYAAQMLSSDYDGACEAREPFERDGQVYVNAPAMTLWLRRVRGQRLGERELAGLLKGAGFRPTRPALNYRRGDGSASTRLYWFAPWSLVRGEAEGEGVAANS